MEFKFDLNEYFKQPVVEINNQLLPPGFVGDRRTLWNTISKVSEVINEIGSASAAAQGLTKPITSSDRLRSSEHKLYLLIDQQENNGKGAVTGMLKIGKKGLYVFDRDGQYYQVSPPCVLDFYVHESRQRNGLGRQLFEHMLQKENVKPQNMAIDRPSDKFLNFLNRHYELRNPIKQMNNFVVFDGFFPNAEKGGQVEENKSILNGKDTINGLQGTITSPLGRYGAPRPHCSMGQIIHNQSAVQKPSEVTSRKIVPAKFEIGSSFPTPKRERPNSLSISQMDEIDALMQPEVKMEEIAVEDEKYADSVLNEEIEKLTVSDDTLSIAPSDIASEKAAGKKTPSHLTEQGFFDLKFYHNKLW